MHCMNLKHFHCTQFLFFHHHVTPLIGRKFIFDLPSMLFSFLDHWWVPTKCDRAISIRSRSNKNHVVVCRADTVGIIFKLSPLLIYGGRPIHRVCGFNWFILKRLWEVFELSSFRSSDIRVATRGFCAHDVGNLIILEPPCVISWVLAFSWVYRGYSEKTVGFSSIF